MILLLLLLLLLFSSTIRSSKTTDCCCDSLDRSTRCLRREITLPGWIAPLQSQETRRFSVCLGRIDITLIIQKAETRKLTAFAPCNQAVEFRRESHGSAVNRIAQLEIDGTPALSLVVRIRATSSMHIENLQSRIER